MEIFVPGAEQGLDVTREFNIFFHSELWRRLQQLGTGLARRLTRRRKDESGLWRCGLPPDLGEPVPAFFTRKGLDVEVKRTELRTPMAGRLPTI
jgi:hypothetical protein